MPACPWAAEALKQGPPADGGEALIGRVEDALDVFDLEKAAHKTIPVAHWGYLDDLASTARRP